LVGDKDNVEWMN